jgi:GNAT superfamily N-acetyltransferase
MTASISIRFATADDAEVIGYHRARMFYDMGQISESLFQPFRSRSTARLAELLDSGEYVGWLATRANSPGEVIAGAGVQLRTVLPHPADDNTFAEGHHGTIINVFTEPAWSRKGIAELLLRRIIDWSKEQKLDRIVLHASAQGRALYQRLGFVGTNEMQLAPGMIREHRSGRD